MQHLEIHPEILKALLASTGLPVAPACPFAFLLDGQAMPLEPYTDWLVNYGLLVQRTDGCPGLTLRPAVERALHLIARPQSRITVTHVSGDRTARAVYVSDGHDVALAMFTPQTCLISEAEPIHDLAQRLLEEIGAPSSQDPPPAPLYANADVMVVMAGLASQAPMTIAVARELLGHMLKDHALGKELLDDLLADELLEVSGDQLTLHQAFRSGDVLEIQRVELPGGDLPPAPAPNYVVFAGPQGQRCMVSPEQDGSGDLLLARLTLNDLRSLIGEMLDIESPGVTCPGCGAWNRPGVRFCETCGKLIPVPEPSQPSSPGAARAPGTLCPICGTRSRPGMRFCEECGQRLI